MTIKKIKGKDMRDIKPIQDIENVEVRKEVFKLFELFPEAFLNRLAEVVICHPINPTDIGGRGKNVYCNYYFRTEDCYTKLDVQCKVISFLSKPAFGGDRPLWKKNDVLISEYVRNGINKYFCTYFDSEEWEQIYCKLGNNVNRTLCEKFILSHFDLKILKEKI